MRTVTWGRPIPPAALSPTANVYPRGYHNGASTLTAVDADFIAANIKFGTTIFGVIGTMIGWLYEYVKSLSVPMPGIALALAEDHSGGGFTSNVSLSVPMPGIAVTVVVV
ncbi:MAG: hypothetical protein V1767_01005 [Chloroflexota bacterium]